MLKKLHFKSLLLIAVMLLGGASAWADTFTKITSTSELVAGEQYIFVYETDNVAMGTLTTSGTTYGQTVGVTITSNSTTPGSDVNILTLGGDATGWTFYTSKESKYISWSSGNSLTTAASVTKACKWTISISSGTATITNVGTNTRKLQYNSGSPRFACYTTSQKKIQIYKKDAPVAVTGVSLNKTSMTLAIGDSETLTATVEPAKASNKNITWSTSDPSVATVDDGVVKGVAEGSATITVTTQDGSKTATCDVTVVDNIPVTGVTLDQTSVSVDRGKTVTLTASVLPYNASDKVVEWSTSNSSVATVDNGVVTGVAVGNATITVTTQDGSKTATCDVTVTKPEFIFYESFDKCDNSGGNDDVWSGLSTTASITADNTGWTFSKGYPADQCARFGTGSANGYAQTPALGTAGNLIVSFKAGAWKDANTTLDLEISNGGTLSASSVTLADQAWSNYEIVIFNATASTKLTFSGNGRFFLDEVKVKEAVKEITVSAAGFATYCASFALDFSGVDGLTAYQAGLNGNNVEFTKVDNVPANTGVLVKATAGTYNVPVVASSSTNVSGNKLVGVTEETVIGKSSAKGTHYVLKQKGEDVGFYQVNNDAYKVRANSAYLALTVGTGAKGFIPVDGTTAIELVDTANEVAAPVYNLQGQRVSEGYKGVVIVNGKKIMMK
jgi:uncharacterized protein YjdB